MRNDMDFVEIEIYKLMEQAGNMGLTQKELEGYLTKRLREMDQEIVKGKQLA